MDDDRERESLNCCPVCDGAVAADLAQQFGDARCPSCGERLFFLRVLGAPCFYRDPMGKRMQRLVNFVAAQLGVGKEEITPNVLFNDLGADSLDAVELVMELEEMDFES